MYDIIFLSYREGNAEINWTALVQRAPWARRVHGVTGIKQAHQTAASICNTRYFWVIDADNVIDDDFDFRFKWPRDDYVQDRVSVWRARNSVNGLVYGYGGIKLLPCQAVLDLKGPVVDFTTSISQYFHLQPDVVSTTVIDASGFDAFRSGFRECVKLTTNIIARSKIKENTDRLNIWMREGEGEFAWACIRGASMGHEYAKACQGDQTALSKINDFDWLRERYEESSHARKG